jgi:hypothetical protein
MATGDISRGLKRRVSLRLGDRTMTGVYADEVYAWLCEAQLEIISRQPEGSIPAFCVSQTWSSTTTPPIVAGTNDYSLPADFLWARLVTLNTVPLQHLQRIETQSARGASLLPDSTKTKGYWWIWNDDLHIDAGSITISDSLKLYYVSKAAQYLLGENTAGTDSSAMYADTGALSETVDPTVSALYWPAMCDYAVARGMEMRQSYELVQFYMAQFDKKLEYIASRFRTGDPMQPEGKPV